MSDPLLQYLQTTSNVRAVPGVPNLYVRESTLLEVLQYADKSHEAGDDAEKIVAAQAWLIAACVCDADGKHLYQRGEVPEHIARLPRSVTEAIVATVAELNGLRTRKVEDAAKNS